MKVVIEFSLDDLPVIKIENAGPVVRIGRDPSIEMHIPESHSRGISWRHADIQLHSAGATLTDQGSSNGTFLQGSLEKLQPQVAVPVQLGSVFLLNKLVCRIVSLDLQSESVPATNLTPSQKPSIQQSSKLLMPVLVVVLLTAFVVIGLWIRSGFSKDEQAATAAKATVPVMSSNPVTNPVATSSTPSPSKQIDPPEQVKSKVTEWNKVDLPKNNKAEMLIQDEVDGPNMEVRPIGKYFKRPKSPPSLLLQQRGNGYPLIALRGGETESSADTVLSGTTLFTLPGYRNTVLLNDGLQVDFWGNLPDLSNTPVLECVSILHAADGKQIPTSACAGISLLRGRLRISSTRNEPVKLKLWFLSHAWMLELNGRDSELVMELLNVPGPDSKRGAQLFASTTLLGMFAKGQVVVHTETAKHQLSDKTCLVWNSEKGGAGELSHLKTIPDWQIHGSNERVRDVLVNLYEWADRIEKDKEEIKDVIRSSYQQSDNPLFRSLAVYFLTAIDELELVIDALNNNSMFVRAATADAMRAWLYQDTTHAYKLKTKLQSRGFSEAKSNLILQLLMPLSEADLRKPSLHSQMLELLSHADLEIRQLAFWHLMKAFPEYSQKSKYDPLAPENERKQEVTKWASFISSRKGLE